MTDICKQRKLCCILSKDAMEGRDDVGREGGTCVTRMVGLALVAVLMLLVGCDDRLPGEAEVSLYASVDAGSAERTESSLSITPSNYVVGLTYFALERDDGLVVPIIESDDPIR